MQSGTAVIDFQARPNERIDSLLTRFDMAQSEAESVGAGMHNYHTLTTILLRVISIDQNQVINLLQPNSGRLHRPDPVRLDGLSDQADGAHPGTCAKKPHVRPPPPPDNHRVHKCHRTSVCRVCR